MGADLTIMKLKETARGGFEVSDEAVESGYFRDCYNPHGLFWVMRSTLGEENISWWVIRDIEPSWFNDDGDLKAEAVKPFKKWISPFIDDFLRRDSLMTQDYDTRNNKYKAVKIPKKDISDYHSWAKKLVRFLDLAIKNHSGIIFSV